MKKEILFLKAVIILIGLLILIPCILWLPSFINYLPYVVLIGVYVTVVVFYFALYQTIKLLGYINKEKVFSNLSLKALDYIKYSALSISIIYMVILPLLYPIADADDAPGLLLFPIIIIGISFIIAVFALVLKKIFKSGIALELNKTNK